MVFGGETGYVDLGQHYLDGGAGITFIATVLLADDSNAICARVFDAGGGCPSIAQDMCSDTALASCDSQFSIGSANKVDDALVFSSASSALRAGADGQSVGGSLVGAAGSYWRSSSTFWRRGRWIHVAVTVESGGALRAYSAGRVVWIDAAAGGFPAGFLRSIYLGRSQNPLDPARWKGGIADVQIYSVVLTPEAITRISKGDSSVCPGAPPPPWGGPSACVKAAGAFGRPRGTAPSPAMRWLFTGSSFDSNVGVLWDDARTTPLAAPQFDATVDSLELRRSTASSLLAPAAFPPTAGGLTIAGWIRWDTSPGTLVKWGVDPAEPTVALKVSSRGAVSAEHEYTANGGPSRSVANRFLQPFQWYHVLVEWTQITVSIYYDGVITTQTGSSGLPPATNRTVIALGPFTGGIADLQIYFRAGIPADQLAIGCAGNAPMAPASPPPRSPPPPPWPPLPNLVGDTGGQTPFGPVHVWLPSGNVQSWSDGAGTLSDTALANRVAAYVTGPALINESFIAGAWIRTWNSSSLSATIPLPNPCGVGMRMRSETPPLGIATLLEWKSSSSAPAISVTVQNRVFVLTIGSASVSLTYNASLSIPVRIIVAIGAARTEDVTGTASATLVVGSFRSSSISVPSLAFTISGGTLTLPSSSAAGGGRSFVTELFVSSSPNVLFLPYSPPVPPAPSPPPPEPPMFPNPPAASAGLIARPLSNVSALAHAWLPQPVPITISQTSWGLADQGNNPGRAPLVLTANSTDVLSNGRLAVGIRSTARASMASVDLPAVFSVAIAPDVWRNGGIVLSISSRQLRITLSSLVDSDELRVDTQLREEALPTTRTLDGPVLVNGTDTLFHVFLSGTQAMVFSGYPPLCATNDGACGFPLILEKLTNVNIVVAPFWGGKVEVSEFWVGNFADWPLMSVYAQVPPSPPRLVAPPPAVTSVAPPPWPPLAPAIPPPLAFLNTVKKVFVPVTQVLSWSPSSATLQVRDLPKVTAAEAPCS